MDDHCTHTGTNIMKEYKKTFSNPDGSEKAGDLKVPTPAEALPVLKELVEQIKSKTKKESKRKKWNFETSPHAQFDKTLDDTFMAFIMWARTKDSTDGNEVNVSKAFRRLETYAEWMDETGTDLIEPPLTASSIKKGLDAWHMNVTSKKDGELIWWADMSKVDMKYLKKEISPEDSLRAFVWYSHYIMYHKVAQEKGLIFVYDMDKLGMVKSFTMMPTKLAAKLDRLTIGVLPIKMKALYMLDSPGWMSLLMKLMGVFMSKKMKERFVMMDDWKKLEEMFDPEIIPKGFGKLEGSVDKDELQTEYFSS